MRFFSLCLLLSAGLAPVSGETNTPAPTLSREQVMEQFAEHALKGFQAEQAKKLSEAVDHYSKALELQPESIYALIRRGICLARLGRNEEAAADLRKATAAGIQARTVSDFSSLAWLRATSPISRFRDGAVAVTLAQRALREQESADHYDILAAAYAEMGNFEQARQTLDRGIKKFPDSPRIPAMKNRMKLYLERKKFQETWEIERS
jgi:tetratricopeptide (TPR) repeat protein